MNSEKVKEIKIALQDHSIYKLKYQDGIKIKEIGFIDILTIINELEAENEIFLESKTMWKRLHTEVCEENQQLKGRIDELGNKIKHGTLIELPCKVGDTVYEVFKYHTPPFIKETTIEKIVITEKGFKLRLSRNSTYETAISSLGKTIFLTEAEAEKKLLELRGEV